MSHKYWNMDKRDRGRSPGRDDMIFIDIPPELALLKARKTVRSMAEDGQIPPGKTEREIEEKLALETLSLYGGHVPFAMRLLS